jgi:hypothetical protein
MEGRGKEKRWRVKTWKGGRKEGGKRRKDGREEERKGGREGKIEEREGEGRKE